jgi:RNA polymerase primary sigma factor
VRDAARTVTSLDRPVNDEDGAPLGELFPSADEEPVEEVDREVREEVVRRAVWELPDPEREIVLRRYGLADDRPQSVEQVVRSLGVSRAEVRQIEHRALERLAGRREVEAVKDVA